MAAPTDHAKNSENGVSKSPGTQSGIGNVSEFSQRMLSTVMKLVQSSNGLPKAGDDFDYYSSFEGVREMLGCEQTRILQGMQELVRHAGVKGSFVPGNLMVDTDDRFDSLVDANDHLLERAGTFLDEAQGHRKPEDTPLVIATKSQDIATAWNKAPKSNHERKKSANFKLLAARYVQRPQLRFREKVDNSNRPFVPVIKKKTNALRPLEDSLIVSGESDSVVSFPHPYQLELERWKPLDQQMEIEYEEKAASLEDTEYVFVDSVPELEKLHRKLKRTDIFSCDLEHHSYRSYLGLTCLIQISTHDTDYIIDTLALRDDVHVLNEVFSDPTIVKIFHGADMDIKWLQRDFGIYVVNMFDTGQAARILGLARYSLSHVLEQYCHVTPDKQYQLADWRIRPLPDELVKYAREDTHYLIYVYRRMKRELLERGNQQKNLLKAVLDRSRGVCLHRYEKPLFTTASHLDLYHKSRKLLSHQQMAALSGIYEWRDKTARQDDESTGYIMPDHMLLQVAEILPKETGGIIAVCNPVPPPVRQYLSDIHTIIQRARKQSTEKVLSEPRPLSAPSHSDKPVYKTCGHILRSRHDTSHCTVPPMRAKLDTSLIAPGSQVFGKQRAVTSQSRAMTSSNPSMAAIFSWRPVNASGVSDNLQKVEKILAKLGDPLSEYCVPVDAATWQSRIVTSSQTDVTSSPREDLASTASDEAPEIMEQTAKRRWGSSLTRKRSASPDRTPGTSTQEKEPQSLRQMGKSPKVPKTDVIIMEKAVTSGLGRELVDSKGNVSKSAIEAEVEARLAQFKAFDYSNCDYSMFENESSKKKKKKKDFEASDDSQFKAHAKFKAKGKTGKSMSYTSGSSEASGSKWPKNKR